MVNPYMSTLRLTKQLEEKAKESQKKRVEAEDLISELEEKIKNDKKAGFEIENIVQDYNEAKKTLELKDYGKSLRKLEECKINLKKTEEAFLETIVTEIYSILAILKQYGTDISTHQVEINNAKNLAEKDIKGSIEELNKLYTSCVETLKKQLRENISILKQNIDKLEEDKKQKIQDAIKESESKLETDPQEAEKILKEATEITTSFFGSKIDMILKEGAKFEEIATSANINIDEALNIKKELNKSIKDESHSKSIILAEKYFDSLGSIVGSFVNKVIKIGEEDVIREGSDMGADVAEAEKTLNEAKEKLNEKNYFESIELVKKATGLAEKAKFQIVLKEISQSKVKFVEAKDHGMDLTNSMKHLENAKGFLKEGKHKKALEEARMSINIIDTKLNAVHAFKNSINNIKNKLEELENYGIVIEGMEGKINEVEVAIKQKNLEGLDEKLMDMDKEISQIMYDVSLEFSEEIDEYITLLEKENQQINEEKMDFDRLVELIQKESYLDATKHAINTREKILKKVEGYLQSEIKRIEEKILEIEETDEVKEFLMRVEKNIEDEDYVSALVHLDECKENLLSKEGDVIEDKIDKIVQLYEKLKAYTGDLSIPGDFITKAKRCFKNEEIRESSDAISAAESELLRIEREVVKKAFTSAKVMTVTAKKAGVDIAKTEIKNLMEKATESLEKGDMLKAIEYSVRVKELSEEYKDKAEAIYNVITDAARKMSDLKKEGFNINVSAKILIGAKKAFEENDFEKARKLADSSLTEVKSLVKSSNLTIIKDEIDLLKAATEKLDISFDAREFYLLYENNDIQKAIEKGNNLKEEIKMKIEDVITDNIARIETEIYEASENNIMVNIEIEEQLEKSKDMFLKKDYINSIDILMKTGEEVESAIHDQREYTKLVSSIESKIQDAGHLDISTEEIRKKLEGVMEIANNAEYHKAGKLAEDIHHDITLAINTKINENISNVEKEVKEAKIKGMETVVAENLLEKARISLRNNDVKEAMKYSMQALGEVEKVELQKEMAYRALKRAEKMVVTYGKIVSNDTKNKIQELKKTFTAGRYAICMQESLKIVEEVTSLNAIIEEIKKEIMSAKDRIKYAHDVNAEVKDALDLYNNAKIAYQKYEYIKALEFIKESTKIAVKALNEKLLDMIKSANVYVIFAKNHQIEEEKVNDIFNKLKDAKNANDFPSLMKHKDELKKIVENGMKNQSDVIIKNIREQFNDLKKKGVDITELQNKLAILYTHLEKEQYDMFFKESEEIQREMKDVLPSYISQKTEKVRSLIKEYEKLGVDLSEAHSEFADIRILFEQSEYEKIDEILAKIENEIESSILEHLKSKLTISINRLKSVESYGLNTEEITKKMVDALEQKEYQKFVEMYDKVKIMISEVQDTGSSVKHILDKVKELTDMLTKIEIDVSKEVSVIEEIEGLIIQDSEKALNMAKKLTSELQEKIDSFKPKIGIEVGSVEIEDNNRILPIILKNGGNIGAKEIDIVVDGIETEKPRKILRLKKDKAERVDVLLNVREPGTYKLTVKVVARRIFDNKEFEFQKREEIRIKEITQQPHIEEIKTIETPTETKEIVEPGHIETKLDTTEEEKKGEENYEIKKAEEPVKCNICMGKVLAGMDMVVCKKCGTTYHKVCAQRFKKCVKCKAEFNFKEKVGKKIRALKV